MELEKLKEEVEKLTRKEQKIIELSREISNNLEEKSDKSLQDLSLIQKIRLERALDDLGKTDLSRKIKKTKAYKY